MDQAAAAIAFARSQIGKPYQWGATGPNSWDCSGLVQGSYKSAGVNLPRTTAQMIFVGQAVAQNALLPGDLVFPDPGHVQIYTGNGNVVEAPRKGEQVREVPMWGFWRAKRVVKPGTQTNTLIQNVGNNIAGSVIPGYDQLTGLANGFTWISQNISRIAFVIIGMMLIYAGLQMSFADDVGKVVSNVAG